MHLSSTISLKLSEKIFYLQSTQLRHLHLHIQIINYEIKNSLFKINCKLNYVNQNLNYKFITFNL